MNITNITLSGSSGENNLAIQITLVLISVPLIALTVIGNLLVLLIWIFHKPIRTPQNAYFVSLAFVDFLTGAFSFPLIVAYGYKRQWDYGLPLCRLQLICLFSFIPISAYHIVAIAVDRYRVLTEGVSYLQRRSLKMVFEIVILMWVLGVMVAGPLILDWDHISQDPSGQMHCITKKIPFLVAHLGFFSYSLPGFLIIRIYWNVFSEFRKRFGLQKNNSNNKGSANPSTTDGTAEKTDGCKSSSLSSRSSELCIESDLPPNLTKHETDASKEKYKIKLARERRSAITLGIISAAFLLCWAPWFTLSLYEAIVPVEYKPPPYTFMFTAILGLANSCFNPIVYAAWVPEFKIALKKIYKLIIACYTNP